MRCSSPKRESWFQAAESLIRNRQRKWSTQSVAPPVLGYTTVPRFETMFAGNFDIPLVAWNPAEMLNVATDRDRFVKEGRRMACALGLALSAYD